MGHSNVGADIFVRKIKPGPTVGDGYLVDVYEGGIKVDTFKAKNKKQIKAVVKDYKSKYNTSRSFMNESQVHVTYRTKAERGETAMITSLDEQLIKKANYIRSALKKLFTPNDPMIIREADIANNTVDFIPQTPGGNDAISEDSIAKNIIIKVVKFISDRQPQEGAEWVKSDELYNPIKKWLFSVKKSVKDQERANGLQLDFGKVYEIAKNTLLSSDPANIKKLSGIDVSPDVASKIKEIMNMKVGVTKQASDFSRDGSDSIGDGSVSSSKENLAEGYIEGFKARSENPEDTLESEIKNKLDQKSKERAARENQDDDSLNRENQFLDNGSGRDEIMVNKGGNPQGGAQTPNVVANDYSNVFWKHASTIKEEATLEDVFLKWASKNNLSLDNVNITWKQVNEDLKIFNNREALYIPAPELLNIYQPFINYVVTAIEKNVPDIFKIKEEYLNFFRKYLDKFMEGKTADVLKGRLNSFQLESAQIIALISEKIVGKIIGDTRRKFYNEKIKSELLSLNVINIVEQLHNELTPMPTKQNEAIENVQ